jgi:hypothetical protein
MDKTKLEKMEELDAKIEKINYDLSGLESRKKEMEESKFAKQQDIAKLEDEKKSILAKTDKMNRLEKIIYIAFASKNDLKQIDLINAKITEHRNEKDNIQNKIDIQNKLYADTIKEKDSYIEQRRELYVENANINTNQKEQNKENNKVINQIKDLTRIYEITMQYPNDKVMMNLRDMVEKQINKQLAVEETNVINKCEQEEQDEME